jgi:hypothetical protein
MEIREVQKARYSYLGNFVLEFRWKVVFERYDNRVRRRDESILFDGPQALEE